MSNLIDIADEIRLRRKQFGMTQWQLAQKSGVSRARIALLESHNISEIGFKNLMRIMNAVGLDLRITNLNQRRPTLEDLIEDADQSK